MKIFLEKGARKPQRELARMRLLVSSAFTHIVSFVLKTGSPLSWGDPLCGKRRQRGLRASGGRTGSKGPARGAGGGRGGRAVQPFAVGPMRSSPTGGLRDGFPAII